jgi:hypothetical protein
MIKTYINYKTRTIHVGNYWTWKHVSDEGEFVPWNEMKHWLKINLQFLRDIMPEYCIPSASDKENAEMLFEVFEMEEGHKDGYEFAWCD